MSYAVWLLCARGFWRQILVYTLLIAFSVCFPFFRILIRRSKNDFKVLFVSMGVNFAIVSSMEVIKPVVFENISLNVELTSHFWQSLEYSECREVDTNIKVNIYPIIQIINPTKFKTRDWDFAGWIKRDVL